MKHARWLIFIAIVVAVIYSQPTQAYFCGYDDFAAVYRASMQDARDPKLIFTTTDFGLPKYRPLERGLLYLMVRIFGPDPAAFRLRNLTAHIVGAFAVYGISWLLFQAHPAAVGAGLIYGVHPLANQAVLGAVWSLAYVYALMLTGFFLFLYSLHRKDGWKPPLLASIVAIWIALFVYEGTIVVYAFIAAYLLIWRLRGRQLMREYQLWLITGLGLAAASMFLVRYLFVTVGPVRLPITAMLRSLAMYLAALSLPVDSVLANKLFGTPLISEVKLTRTVILVVAAAGAVGIALAAYLFTRPAVRSRIKTLPVLELLLVAGAAVIALGPFVVYMKPSETYLYLPVAFYAMLISMLLWRLCGSKSIYGCVLGLLLLLFAAATWERGRRVQSCGETAERILAQLPVNLWRSGEWHIRLATPPGSPSVRRYGLYGYHGLATIDPKEPGMTSAEWALQTFTQNDQIKAQVVEPEELRGCNQPHTCFWVSDGGQVRDAVAADAN